MTTDTLSNKTDPAEHAKPKAEHAKPHAGHTTPQAGPRQMIRLRPNASLGQRFPAMNLVRSSWFARFLARITFLFLVGLGLAATFLPWQQTSRCEGEVVARLPQLRRQVATSTAKGIISYMKPGLREGSPVTEGEVIMRLEAFSKDQLAQTQQQKTQLLEKAQSTREILTNSREQVLTGTAELQQTIEAYEADVRAAKAKWQQSLNKIQSQKNIHAQALFEVKALESLKGRAISMIDYERAVNREQSEYQKLLEAEATEDEADEEKISKERSLDSKKKEVEGKILELRSKVEDNQSKVNSIVKEIQDVDIKLGELDRLEILSPSSGIIQAILGQVGANTVKEGDKLFEVIPDTADLAVELNVRGLDLPLVHVGDEVRLQFDGWPAIQFVGWPSVAIGTFGGKVIAINPSNDSKGIFKIIVGPDPDDPKQEKWPDSRYLRQGVRANGWVILNTVPLYFEIWRQINGFPPTLEKSAEGDEKAKDSKLPKMK